MKRQYLAIISLILSILATYSLWKRIHDREKAMEKTLKKVEIIVAGRDISPGDRLTSENLRSLPIPEGAFSPRMLKAEDFQDIDGAICANSVKKGNPLVWSDIELPIETERFSKTISSGKRAVTISADEKMTFSGLIRPGDKVDVITVKSREGNVVSSLLLLENAPVVAVSGNFESEGYDVGDGGTITLMLSPVQASALIRAASDPTTKIYFTLRNPEDRGVRRKRKMKETSLEFYVMGHLDKTIKIREATDREVKK